MIAPFIQAVDPIFSFAQTLIALPRTVWDWVKDIIRYSVSLNGYTAVDPDGVLTENKESEDEGESKED